MPCVSTVISNHGVEQLLRRIQPDIASGPNAIPARLLKECASSIATILADVFRRSLKTCYVPACLPDFKKSKPDDPATYRPISLTSITSKLLEHIVNKSNTNNLDCRGLLSNLQHGFGKVPASPK